MPETDHTLASSLGEIVRRQRELSALSMRQFAAMAGISNPYLSQIERGLREPSEQVAEAIAGALRTSVDALYREAGIKEAAAPSAVAEAIEADPDLSARQRQALLTTYEAFLQANGGPKRRRRPRRRTSGDEQQPAAKAGPASTQASRAQEAGG
jgi:transcriptional regulator with XRE-family HTH domain